MLLWRRFINEKNAVVNIQHFPNVKGVPLQLGQLFQNLISNSLKFAHPEKQLQIDISAARTNLQDNPAIKIVYRDNGIGFRQDQAEKIFEIFYRLHTKDQYEGTGMGLAIVKKIIDFHKGAIHASGKENEGARFTIFLPTVTSDIEAEEGIKS